jgi:AraC-like DNA-binding protein
MEREELLTEKGRVLYEQSQLSRLLAVDRESTDALDENHVRALGIDFSHSTCRIGVIRMFSGQNNPRPSERIFDEGRALDICRALLEKQGYPSLCVGYEGYIVCFLPLDDSKEECCLEFWKVFIEMIHKLYGLSISIGVGRLCRSFDDIPDSFDDAVFAAEDCETAGDVQIWQPLDGPSESLAARIGKVRNFIQENYTDKNLTLNVLSSRIYLSPAYISTLFKRYIGKNFKSYLTFLRMKKACELLTESAFCTFEISEAIGYPNSQYFSVLFKKHTGMAPTEYREKFRKVVSGVPKLPFGSLAP